MHQLQVPQWRVKASSIFISLFLPSFSSISPSHLCVSYTDIKINTVCVWLVHRMHRHYRIHRLRMYDPPPPTFTPQSSRTIPILSVTLLFSTSLSLLANARENCSCSALQSTWSRGWVKVWTVNGKMKDLKNLTLNGVIKWRSAWDNKWSNQIYSLDCFCFSNTWVLEFLEFSVC